MFFQTNVPSYYLAGHSIWLPSTWWEKTERDRDKREEGVRDLEQEKVKKAAAFWQREDRGGGEAGAWGRRGKKGLQRINWEQRKENNGCKSMSGPCVPVPQPCLRIVKIPVRQQRRELVIVFPGYRGARHIKSASGRETGRDTVA